MREDIEGIFEYLQGSVAGYGHLKWNEVAMMKADMMNMRPRWLGVDVHAFRARCVRAGMTDKETAEMVDYLRRTQAGKRLVPQRTYRDFRFAQDPPEPENGVGPVTSRQW